jgi:hypothetical protein
MGTGQGAAAGAEVVSARKRRRNGEGNIRLRADGRWMGQMQCGFRPDGRPRIVSVYAKTERDALKELRKVRARLDANKSPTVPTQTLTAFADAFFAGAEQRLKASTVKFYRDNWKNYIGPLLGNRPVAGITRADAVTLVRSLRQKGLKLPTVRGIKATLSAILSEAVELGLLEANPAQRMRKHLQLGQEQKSQPDPFTRDEADHLLASAREHFARW